MPQREGRQSGASILTARLYLRLHLWLCGAVCDLVAASSVVVAVRVVVGEGRRSQLSTRQAHPPSCGPHISHIYLCGCARVAVRFVAVAASTSRVFANGVCCLTSVCFVRGLLCRVNDRWS